MPVGRPPNANSNDFLAYTTKKPAKGVMKHGKPAAWVRFSQSLFDQISAEALKNEWSFTRMVNHLCEASIDGIE